MYIMVAIVVVGSFFVWTCRLYTDIETTWRCPSVPAFPSRERAVTPPARDSGPLVPEHDAPRMGPNRAGAGFLHGLRLRSPTYFALSHGKRVERVERFAPDGALSFLPPRRT
jgi:hypothetical protein